MVPRTFECGRRGWATLALAAVLAACEGYAVTPTGPLEGPTLTAPTPDNQRPRALVYMYDDVPSPGNLAVHAGELVEWKNAGSHDHSVSTYGTPDEWEDTMLKPGESFLHVFQEPGEYAYICIVHGEVGNISVSEPYVDTSGSG